MRVLGIIPARGGSKGIPNKNIVTIGGRPLIEWTIETSLQSSLERTILSTDSPLIAEIGRKAGAEVPFLRPSDMATDSANVIPVLIHALDFYKKHGEQYEAVMMLQPTSPLRQVSDINDALELLRDNPEADAVISVVPVGGHHPARMKYLRDGYLTDPPFSESYENQPRAELPSMYIRNGAIYLVRKRVLLKHQSLKGKRCLGLVMPEERSVNIDTPFDLEFASWLILRNREIGES